VARFLEAIAEGPAALVLQGEPGIGKTVVWRAGVAAARRLSYRVLITRPTEAESRLSYSALGDLLDEALGEAFVGSRPPPPRPQREALEVALLRRRGRQPRPDQRAVSLAALAVLKALSSVAPLVVAIDDVQWLDSPSAQVLKFAIRRLGDERVGILFASRGAQDDEDPFGLAEALTADRVERLTIGPVSIEALDGIVRGRLGAGLPRPVLVQLHQASGGNPFYALEIARAMERGERPTGQLLPVPETLRELIRDRLRKLPARTRAALVAAAALSRPTVTLVGSAVASGTAKAAMARGLDAGVIEVDGENIRFTHPLFGSVLYSDASNAARSRLHRRLAAIVADHEERAWHLALSVDGPDAGVAAALDEAAAKARARGAPDAAAKLAEQAWQLTPAERNVDARRRAVEAAEFYEEAGNTERCRALLEEVVAASPPGEERARALIRLAWTRSYQDGLPSSVDLFHQVLAECGEDLATRVEAEMGLAWSFHLRDVITAQSHARAAVESARRFGDRRVLAEALAVDGFVQALLGRDRSVNEVEQAVSIEGRAGWTPQLVRPRWILGILFQWAGNLHAARDILQPLYRVSRERGDENALPNVLGHLSRVECRLGHWEVASRLANEAYQLTLQTGQRTELPYVLYARALADACMGNIGSVRADVDEGLELAGSTMIWGIELSAVLGFVELSLGDAGEAHRHLAPIVEALESAGVEEPGVFRVHPDEIEALISLGDLERAKALLGPFEERAKARNHVWAMPLAGRCRGLLLAAGGDFEGAIRSLETALRDHERLPEPFELARTLHAKGVVERRAKRKREARASLERALSMFDELGAALWSERTRAELARIGGRAPAPLSLTPTEARVAALVSRGSTNREAADALFMSVNTVEANLKRIYRKLGIRSRTELSATMRSPESGAPTDGGA
jgi:DNA-binding CsgD family transcriptional regulator